MFKLTGILVRISNLLYKYSSLILSVGFIALGVSVYFYPAELSKNAGMALFITGLFFGLLILMKSKRK